MLLHEGEAYRSSCILLHDSCSQAFYEILLQRGSHLLHEETVAVKIMLWRVREIVLPSEISGVLP